MVGAWTAPSHYLNRCWNIVNWTLRNKLQWNFSQNSYIFIQEMHLKTSSAKWRTFCLSLNVLNNDVKILHRRQWHLTTFTVAFQVTQEPNHFQKMSDQPWISVSRSLVCVVLTLSSGSAQGQSPYTASIALHQCLNAKDITPLLMYCGYVSFAFSHHNVRVVK